MVLLVGPEKGEKGAMDDLGSVITDARGDLIGLHFIWIVSRARTWSEKGCTIRDERE